jgi:alkylated DNA repair dioxygenase AlkB
MDQIILEKDGDYSIFIYYQNVLDKKMYDKIYNWLQGMNDFVGGETSYGGKIPRLQKWYHSENMYFSNDWGTSNKYERWMSHNYDETLLELQNYLQQKINNLYFNYNGYNNPLFNSCLINKYRNGNDSIKRHSDNQSHFGENPTILGLSFGESRTISFERRMYDPMNPKIIKKDKNKKDNFNLKLEGNSMFIMAGSSQKYFTHEVKKEINKTNTRYNMTFREHH